MNTLYCELLKLMADNGAINKNGQVNEAVAKRAREAVCRDKKRIKKMFKQKKQNAKKVDFNKYKSETQKLADEQKNKNSEPGILFNQPWAGA